MYILNYLSDIINLSWALAKANFKLKTEGSYLGIFWYLLDPLIFFVVLMFVFRKNLGTGIEHYPLYLISGLIMFNFFSTATSQAVSVLNSNSLFIKSIKIKLESLILATVLQTSFSHIFELIIFALFLFYFGLLSPFFFSYFIIFPFYFIFVLGTCFLLATGGVYASDFNNIWKFVTQILFFFSPIFYIAQNDLHSFINPLYYFFSVVRDLIIYNNIPSWKFLSIPVIISIVVLIMGIMIFSIFKDKFAEQV